MTYAPEVLKQFYGIVTNELFRDSGFEDKQNRGLIVMIRKGIYISYI